MKNKAAIRQQIKHLYNLKKQTRKSMVVNNLPLSLLKTPMQIVDYSILTLKWVLGYKTNYKDPHYWCFGCNLMHGGLTCPQCGNNKTMENPCDTTPTNTAQ